MPVLGYRTDAFPGFYRRDSGHPGALARGRPRPRPPPCGAPTARSGVACRDGAGAARTARRRARRRAARPAARRGPGAAWRERGITGKDVTPALLEHFHAGSGGASLRTNLALVRANAELAAQVAVALARLGGTVSAARRPRVVVVGDVGVDVLVAPPTPAVARRGRPGADPDRAPAAPGRTPRPGSPTSAPRSRWSRGWAPTPPGRAAVAELAAAGVLPAVDRGPGRADLHRRRAGRTDGERTMLSDRGAAARLRTGRPARRWTGPTTCTCPATCCSTRRPARPGSRHWPPPARRG